MINSKILIYIFLNLLFFGASTQAMKQPKKQVGTSKAVKAVSASASSVRNQHDAQGKTPLHRAVIENDIPEIKDLLEHGAKLSIETRASTIEAPDFMRNKAGYTVFHLAACKHGEHGIRIKKLLLYYALLQNAPALLDALSSPLYSLQAFAVGILQERALGLKKILEMHNAEGDTAAEIEIKRDAFGKPLPYHGDTALFAAFKVNTDLRAFVTAVQYGTVSLLPSTNIFKAAHDALPKPQ